MDVPLMSQKDDKIIAEANERFRRCSEREKYARENWKADMRFGYGDNVNNFQWDTDQYGARIKGGRPCQTVNKVKNYCLQIVNDARQNKAQIRIIPTGGGASYDAAQVYEGVCRHIEYVSNAEQAYDKATHDQVFGGLGWWRIITDYVSEDSFDQEIFIKRVPDALSVYLDPDITEYDGSDAKYGFVFTDKDRKLFDKEYPKFKDIGDASPLNYSDGDLSSNNDQLWMTQDRVRILEYYRVVEEADTLHYALDGSIYRESEVEDRDALKQVSVRSRDTMTKRIEWYLIAGGKIIEKREWAGKYIPLVRVVGEETVIDQKLDRCGHVRGLVGPQQNYNWFTSGAIENIAMQSKSPWIAPSEAVEEHMEEWSVNNIKNAAVLTYNSLREDGTPIQAPTRINPPTYAPAFSEGRLQSAGDMEMASGQPPATLGEASNERSGKAINERQRAAANQTFQFPEHLACAIRFTGKILIDLIPKIYDTPRIMKILAVDGSQQTIAIDPNAPQGHKPVPGVDSESFDPMHVAAIFNPNVGQFDVEASIGPQYETRRQQSFDALSDIIAQSGPDPMLMKVWAQNSDFPDADELAQYYADKVPNGPPPELLQAQQLIAQQHGVINAMTNENESLKSKAVNSELQKEIDWYKAETDRLKAVGGIDPAALMPVVRELVSQVLGMPVNQVIQAHAMEAHTLATQAELAPLQNQGNQ